MAFDLSAATHYVDLNSTNATPPFTTWTTASTNIQDAIDVSVDGDSVLVTNGVYNESVNFNGLAILVASAKETLI